MSALDEIIAHKREQILNDKQNLPIEKLKAQLESLSEDFSPRGFRQKLLNAKPSAIIAEIKKASPSRGVIREDFDIANLAYAYQIGGASCLSILTDQKYFQGHDDYLLKARKASILPLLRKDFMIDPYQIYQSRLLGADCILLIMAILEDALAAELYEISTAFGMDVLVEIHDIDELERAQKLSPQMIGINNRNLKTLEIDLRMTERLAMLIPKNCLLIAESGLRTPEDLHRMYLSGAGGFLIGESLMLQENITIALQKLIAGFQTKIAG